MFFSFRLLFSTPHSEEVLQLLCVYGASQEYQLVSIAGRRIICSSGSRPRILQHREISTTVTSGSRKRGEKLEKEVPSLTQPLQEAEKEEEEVVITLEYAQGVRIFRFILLVWHGERKGAGP